MFFASKSDVGPHVVFLQALLRLHGYNLTISGHWQEKTEEAVGHFRMRMGLPEKHGPVNGPVMERLLQGKKIKIIDAIDGEAGEVYKWGLKSMKDNNSRPVVNTRRIGHGVEDAMSRIQKRAKDHKIGALRFTGHGNRGTWISVALGDPVHAQMEGRWDDYNKMEADWPSYIDYNHVNQMKPILKTLAPCFAPFAFVEAHSCKIGQQTALLEALADIWGVPVSGGMDNQQVNAPARDKWGNKVISTFSLIGKVNTAYPGNMNLAQWAKQADQAIPNFPGLIEQGRNAINRQLNR